MKSIRGMVIIFFFGILVSGCKGGDGGSNMLLLSSGGGSRAVIASINPHEVKAGNQIMIAGTGFGDTQGASIVSIGGVTATSIGAWSDTLVLATAPAGAGTGRVTITVNGQESNPDFITVLWEKENPENVAVCTAAGTQASPQLISDNSGGAIIAWKDYRSGNYNIYAQKINSAGAVQWTADGVAICTAASAQEDLQLISDGSGGAIIVWEDLRSGNWDIYAQRINSAGAVEWTANGVAVCTAANNQSVPRLISDGSGGAIIVWTDLRSGNGDIYAQRINSAGTVQWTANGAAICTAADTQTSHQLVSDGSGGAIIAWHDYRSGSSWDVYAQRINSAGAVNWTANGVIVCTAANSQTVPQLISDGSGGAIIDFEDTRSGGDDDIYAQRVNSAGAVQWTANGVAICTAANAQGALQLTSDDSGGAIIVWEDFRSGNYDVYAQRVNSAGAVQWTANGVAICTAANAQGVLQLTSDGLGGAIIAWHDSRSGNYDIYAQRINSTDAVQWTANGVAVCTGVNAQEYPQLISDGLGGAIIVWQDMRSGNYDIYAQAISPSGRQ